MACCSGGFGTDRFKISIDKNFLCPICADVLKDPVQCQNQHYFCKECIKKHLETNAKSCPICVQDLSEETLAEAPRILTDYLNGLMISCDHSERGCTEKVPVSRLKSHIRECDFRPIVCTNEKCGQTFNQKDLADHVTNECEYRTVHCRDCDDDMIYKKFGKHACVLSKDLNKMGLDWLEIKNVLGEICKCQKEMCNYQKEMFNSQKEMCNSQKEMHNSLKEVCNYQNEIHNSQKEMCNVLKEMSTVMKGLTHNLQKIAMSQASLPNVTTSSIIVIGGQNENALSSVEVLYPGSKTWTLLQPMQESRGSAASVLYGNDVIVAGGRCGDVTGTIEKLSLVTKPITWIPFPVKLPLNLCGHKAVVINNCLYLVGGYNKLNSFNTIYSILLHSPYSVELKYEMEQPICFHGLQAVGESLFIFGGATSNSIGNIVDTVLSYNTVNNEVSEMKSLPFPIGDVATVQWNNNVIIIGGTSSTGISLNVVILYDVKENKLKMLPSMRHARSSCAVTITGNKVMVMGGYNRCEKKYLSSVECFDLDSQLWEELPEMNEGRSEATAIAFAGLC